MQARRAPGLLTAAVSLLVTADCGRGMQPPAVLAFRLGPVLVRPQVEVSERYDNNIFYYDRNEVDDFVTQISPGVGFSVGQPEESHIYLNYALDSPFYAEHDQLNQPNHSLSLQPRWRGPRLDIRGVDTYQILNSVLGGIYLRPSTQTIQRSTTANEYTVEYALSPKSLAYARGAYTATDWETGIYLQDYNTVTGTGGFGFQAMPKVLLFGEGHYGQSAVSPNRPYRAGDPFSVKGPHLTVVGASVGARGDFTPKLSGEAKLGYEFREFSNGAGVPAGLVAGLGLTHRLSERTVTRISYTRQSVVSVEYSGQAYVLDAAGLQFSQRFGAGEKWTANLTGSVGSYGYSGNVFASRQDFLYTVGLGLTYAIQEWMRAGLAYDLAKFESNYPGAMDYYVHRLTVRLSVGY